MKPRLYLPILTLILAALACGEKAPAPTPHFSPTVESTEQPESIFDTDQTAYGFFPSPPEASTESVLGHFQALGDHADFILIQPNIPWEDFMDGVEGDSKSREDLSNQVILAQMNGLECVFVVDPLNGLNRTAFFGLPEGWEPSFGDPNVRQAFTNFTLWIVRELEPRYLGLASEINTYMDAHPADVGNYLSLYAQVYNLVKAEAPETQIFVTFQWDDLNNMFPTAAEGRERYQTNWDQIEAFEPRLDLWVISSYPYFVFHSGEGIPTDYYTPLLDHTAKPLAVAEGGWSTKTVGPISGDPKGQTAYLEAIHDQLGGRLKFWVYIILNDLDMESIGEMMAAQGRSQADVSTLSMFAFVGLRESDGTPKPALALWDLYRNTR